MSTLTVNGVFHNVGLPGEPLPSMMTFDFMPGGYCMSASHIGSRPGMLAMLSLAGEQNVERYEWRKPTWARAFTYCPSQLGTSHRHQRGWLQRSCEGVRQSYTGHGVVPVNHGRVFGKRF